MLDWDWEAAEAGFRQAIALNPSSDGAHQSCGPLLAGLGRSSEAVQRSTARARAESAVPGHGNGPRMDALHGGRLPAAIETCRLVMDMQRLFTPAWRVLGAALIQMGRAAEGIAELEAAAATAPTDPVVLAWLAHAKAHSGVSAVWRTTILAALRRQCGRNGSSPPYHLALAHVATGRRRGGVPPARCRVRGARPGARAPRVRASAVRADSQRREVFGSPESGPSAAGNRYQVSGVV